MPGTSLMISSSILAAALGITLAAAPVASASSLSSGSSNRFLQDAVVGSTESPGSSGSSLNLVLDSLAAVGSAQLPLSGPLVSSDPAYPLPTIPGINQARIVKTEVENAGQRLERWTIASPSMQRNVEVQIQRPADSSVASPMLYLLDGIGAPSRSGWVATGLNASVYGQENVTLVMPTQAHSSMYSDWVNEDPALGVHMWETFLVAELAPLLEEALPFNGRRGIGGLSMGAVGALHLANTNPDFFHGTFGISGCYSTLDPIGRQIANIVVGSRGGDVENMWGPFGSGQWRRHDVVGDPEGLRTMAVYLSAGNGVFSEADRLDYDDAPFTHLTSGSVLERGVLECTRNLDDSMREAGMDHQVVNYKDHGVHHWNNYREEAQPAWDTIRSALGR